MSLNVCRRCGIPVWSAVTKYCDKCWDYFHKQAMQPVERGKK